MLAGKNQPMRTRRHSQRGIGGSDFIVWAVVALFLVFGTTWLINHLYKGEWAATDPRGAEGQSWMARSAAESGMPAPEPEATPPPAFSDFNRTSAK